MSTLIKQMSRINERLLQYKMGLFLPMSTNFKVNARDFLLPLNLSFLHDHKDVSIIPDDDCFIKFYNKSLTWTLLISQFSALYTRPFVKSNLPQDRLEEKRALQDLRLHTNLIIKPANKGLHLFSGLMIFTFRRRTANSTARQMVPQHPGHPVECACCCPTETMLAYFNEVITPLVGCLSTFVKIPTMLSESLKPLHFTALLLIPASSDIVG